MNSLQAEAIKWLLRLNRPLLLRVRHPRQLRPYQFAAERLVRLPAGCQLSAVSKPTRLGRPEPAHTGRPRPVRADKPAGQADMSQRSRPLALQIDNLLPTSKARTLLIYLHGGGFNLGSPDMHKGYAARLMLAGGMSRTLLPYYRLAPKYPHPAGFDDIWDFWQQTVAQYPGWHIALAGESAGAALVLMLCQRLRDEGGQLPQRVFLHSPWLDIGLNGASYVDSQLNDGFIGNGPGRRDWLERVFARHYRGASDTPSRPERLGQLDTLGTPDLTMTPLMGSFVGLPPLLVHTGTHEIFIDDSRSLAAKCHADGCQHEVKYWRGMWHAFGLLAPYLPEANRSIASAGRWLAVSR